MYDTLYDSNEHSYSCKTWPTESNTGDNQKHCGLDGSISLTILSKQTTNLMGYDLVQVEVQLCESSWTNICDGDWSLQNISHFCNPKAMQLLTGIVLV